MLNRIQSISGEEIKILKVAKPQMNGVVIVAQEVASLVKPFVD